MLGHTLATTAYSSNNRQRLIAKLLYAIGGLLGVWLIVVGILVATRTANNAAQPFSLGWLLLSALVLALVATVGRAAWILAEHANGKTLGRRLLPVVLTTVGMAIWTLVLGSHTRSLLGVTLFVLIAGGEEAWGWRSAFRDGHGFQRAKTSGRATATHVMQQLTRVLSPDGEESIEGSVAVSVDRGSRFSAAHVGFCPPFASRPEFEVSATDKGVVLKVGQLLPQGARIEVKLPAPAEAARMIAVQFVARARNDADGPMAV